MTPGSRWGCRGSRPAPPHQQTRPTPAPLRLGCARQPGVCRMSSLQEAGRQSTRPRQSADAACRMQGINELCLHWPPRHRKHHAHNAQCCWLLAAFTCCRCCAIHVQIQHKQSMHQAHAQPLSPSSSPALRSCQSCRSAARGSQQGSTPPPAPCRCGGSACAHTSAPLHPTP